MRTTDLLRVLQFGDSAFPVGGFSFSNGLESASQHGVVHDLRTLGQFVRTAVDQAATVDGVALVVAHRAASRSDLGGVIEADHALLQRKLNEEMRTMTTRMGRKLAEIATHMLDTQMVGQWLGGIREGLTPGTHPVGLAVVFAELGLDARQAFAAHQYGIASMMLGAALRLMRVSFMDTQAILLDINGAAEEAYERIADASLDHMAGFTPLADIVAASHLHAHIRMFMN
jgi:urease accessory protein